MCAAVVMVYHTTSCIFCLSSGNATVMHQDFHLSKFSHKCYLNTSGLTTENISVGELLL